MKTLSLEEFRDLDFSDTQHLLVEEMIATVGEENIKKIELTSNKGVHTFKAKNKNKVVFEFNTKEPI